MAMRLWIKREIGAREVHFYGGLVLLSVGVAAMAWGVAGALGWSIEYGAPWSAGAGLLSLGTGLQRPAIRRPQQVKEPGSA